MELQNDNEESTKNDVQFNQIQFPDDQVYSFDLADFEEGKNVGSSQFFVKSFLHKPSGKMLAIKEFQIGKRRFSANRKKNEKIVKLQKEAKILQKLKSSEYILQLYGLGSVA